MFFAHPVQADDEVKVTIISGTDAADTMIRTNPIDAQADLTTDESEKIEASATALDSLAGNDMILSEVAVTANADATALLLQILDAKTQALAKSLGLVSGDGDDTLTSRGPLAVTSVAGGAYAGALVFDTGDRDGEDRKIDISLNTEAGSTAIDAGDGDDTVNNDGILAANATAISGGTVDQLTAEAQGPVSMTSKSSAKAETTGIATGDGADAISNTNAIDSIATATSGALGLSISAGENAEGDKAKTELDVSAGAEATAIGIESDGDDAAEEDKDASPFGLDGLRVTYEKETTAVSGTDSVTNFADVQAVATATSGAGAASIDVAVDGTAQIKANAEAKAESIGMSTGAAQDTIANTGDLSSVATATAGALSAAFQVGAPTSDEDPPTTTGSTSDNNSSSQSEATATARAVGIASDGEGQFKTVSASAAITDMALVSRYEMSEGTLSDADQVANMGDIAAIATATAGSESAAIEIMAGASVESKANAEATSASVAIFTGGEDDTVSNAGALDALATSTAGAISVSLGVSGSSNDGDDDGGILDNLRERFWPTVHSEANATATASARGIDTEGGVEDKSTVGDLSLDRQALNLLFAYDETQASGHDHVANDGAINAVATATSGAGAADIQINSDGTAAAEANSTATAQADAIRTGGGDDTVDNTGTLTAVATATSGALSVGVSHADGDDTKARAQAKATSTAQATGIDTEGGNDSREVDFSLDLSREGLHVNYNDTKTAASGNDEVVNQAAVTTVATASSGAAAIPVSIDGAASADVTSKATAAAMAIHTGGGHDVIDNSGVLTAASQATSAAIGVGFGQQTQSTGKTKVEVKAAAESTASAMGIATDGDAGDQSTAFSFSLTNEGLVSGFSKSQTAIAGDDTLTNTGNVATTATASSGAAGVAVAIDGAAAVDITSTTEAAATGVDTGGGDDHIDNQGDITSTATATSIALGVGVGVQNGSSSKASSNVEAAAKSEALAVGITADGNQQDTALEIDLAITEDGLSAGYHQNQTPVAGDDDLINTGAVTAVATATSGAGAVGVTTEGSARSDASATAKADARALDVGGGSDTVDNRGALSAVSTATAAAVEVSVSGKGTTIVNNGILSAGTTAEAQAVGIAGADAASAETLDITLDVDFNDVSAGFVFEKVVDGIEGDGGDTITNTAGITTVATATAPEVSVAVTSEGIAASLASTEATAKATAIESGHGDDTITTSGDLSATATATAAAVNVAVTGKGLAVAGNAVWDGGAKADAKSAGIHSEGGERNTLAIAVDASLDGVAVSYEKTKELASGEDTVVNDGNIAATAVAVAPEVSVAVSSQGVAASLSTSMATSEAFGIRTGDAGDDITNRGNITAVANADAVAVNVAVAPTGGSVAGNNFWDGGTKAETSAFGIDADGETASETQTRFTADASGAAFNYDHQEILASGDDVIRNDGDVTAVAVSVAPALSVAVTAEGVAAALSTATATSDARAIRGGDGDDIIENTGNLTAVSNADAFAVNVSVVPTGGVSAAGNNFWDGGNKAEALAIGIDGDGENYSTSEINVDVNGGGVGIERSSRNQMAGGDDRIVNSGDMDITAVAVSPSIATAVTVAGVSAAISTAKATSDAWAIRGGDGSDTIENTGNLTVFSNADAAAVNVSVNAGGGVALASDAIWDGGTTAETKAFGIDAEGESSSSSTTSIDIGASVSYDQDKTENQATGDDIVNNQGDIGALAIAVAPSVAVSVVGTGGVAGAFSTATAKADSTAISTGAGDDTITNSGALTSSTVANADAVSVSVTGVGGVSVSGNNVWDGGTKSEAKSRGIDSGAGDDTLTNTGAIDTSATTVTASGALSVVGVGGVAGAISTATATSDSTAIDTGAGDDTIINNGNLTSAATAIAAAANVSVTGVGGVSIAGNNAWDGGTLSEAKSRGIDSGDGDDNLTNSGDVSVSATTVTATGSVSVTGVGGVSGAVSTSTAKSDAVAIATGAGEDEVDNSGVLTAEAFANADGLNVAVTGVGGVSVAGNNAWDGGTLAEARAAGIDGEALITNTNSVSAAAEAVSVSAALSYVTFGVPLAISTSTADADAAAIRSGDQDDDLTNSGALTASSEATAVSVNVAVTGAGVAGAGDSVWDGGTKAKAASVGMDARAGEDVINNTGTVDVDANAVTSSNSVAFTVAGVSGAVSTSTATADAQAISGGDGDDTLINEGALDSSADATAVSVSFAASAGGVAIAADAVWDGGTTADAHASGLDGGRGDDTIQNTADVDTIANSTASSNSVAMTVAGVSGAVSTATSTAAAAAIDTGEGDDRVLNDGMLSSIASAGATSVSVALTAAGGAVAGDAFWDGGTKATVHATGIALGSGNDTVTNHNGINADATSRATSVAVALSGIGLAGAAAAATSTANATGISGDDGSDDIANDGVLVAESASTAEGVSIAFSTGGAALAGSFVDNATTAEAVAIGLAGGRGNDRIMNNDGADVNLTGRAEVVDTAVSVGLVGLAEADSQALAMVQAKGIDGGDGNDTLINNGSISGTQVTAESTARGISFALAGAALSSADATAEASAVGISGGQGNDRITNNGSITMGPRATSNGQTVGVSAIGASINNASATSSATATGLGGGQGRDTILNNSTIDATVLSVATAKSEGAVIGGYSLNKANTTAHAEAVGIDGGEDDDDLLNAEAGAIAITAEAQVFAKSLTVSVFGDASGEANTSAESTATGLRGGTGDDDIANRRDVTVSATARGDSAGASIGLFGSTHASAASTVDAVATGIDGGDDEDVIENDADIGVHASAIADASSLSLNLGGAGEADAGARATAVTRGIDGGAHADDIYNHGRITAFSEASAYAVSETEGLAGDAQGNASTAATAMAIGIDGGSGADVLYNGEDVTVHTKSFARASSASSVLFGGAGSQGGTLSHAAANGISGGSEEDWIINAGHITIGPAAPTESDVMSEAIAESSTWTLIGDGQATATVTATGDAVGIDGGGGNDLLENTIDASITAFMKTHARADGNGEGGFIGSPEAVSTSRADAAATGIAGGEGADWIYTLGFIRAEAKAIADADSDADVFAGNPRAESATCVGVSTTGIDAGAGLNDVWNGGAIEVVASAETRPAARADSDIASNRANSSSDVSMDAAGIRAGSESDRVINAINGTVAVDVTAIAEPFATSDESSTAQVGGGSGAPSVIQASGIDAGDGDNAVFNAGPVTVDALIMARPRAESRSLTLTATSRAYLSLLADITGIKSEAGDDQVINANDIDVTATVDGTAYAIPRAGEGSHIDHAYAEVGRPDRPLDLQVAGIDAQAGDNEITNYGRITTVLQNEENLPITAHAHADTDITRNSAEAMAGLLADAAGIRSGAGNDVITNGVDSAITVDSNLAVDADARADEDATAVAGGETDSAWVLNSNASGIDAGEGLNSVANFGNIDVAAIEDIHAVASASSTTMTARANARINAHVDAVGIRTGEGDDVLGSFGEMTVSAQVDGLAEALERDHTNSAAAGSEDAFLTADAKGIDAGGGQNIIHIQGRMEITAEANSESYAEAECATCTENAQAYARARAAAEGIAAGEGINRIVIEGTVGTQASATAQSTARAPERYGPDEYATADSEAWASAYGILIAGNQDSVIRNMGRMVVTSEAQTAVAIQGGPDYRTAREYAESTAMGISTGDGQHVIQNDGDIVVSASIQGNSPNILRAVGIQTGSGDDIIVNNGSLTTSVEDLDGTRGGVAITTGAGNDMVALMAASETTGSADLGDGDDRLNLVEDAALTGDAAGGAGRDALVLYGLGFYGGAIDGFETVAKYNAGTFGLNGLPTMNELSVYDGIIQTQGSYAFDENGSALMRIHLDGFGQFQVADTVDLGGALSVLTEARVFHNGQIFPIIQSGELIDTFDDVSLPETRPLLGFALNYNYDDQQVEVTTRTRPFRTVARNANERAIADYLDRIAPGATGEMSRVLGEFQTLQGNQFGEAFAGMSPASYGASTGAALNTARLNTQVVSQRMQSLGSGASAPRADASSSGLEGVLLAYNGPSASLGDLKGRKARNEARRRWGAWANVYGQWTTQDTDDGFVGYDSDTYGIVLGMDYAVSETWLAGLSFGYASNGLNFDTNAGDGDIDSTFGSLYTGWYDDAFYLESVLTYGSQAFDNKRNVVVGATRYTARSDHDGNLYSAYLGSGYNFGDDGWNVGPFVSLQYLYLDEDGFEEKGAGVLNLIVDDRQTDALVSQLGGRVAGYFDTDLGILTPELRLAWLYDFDIDDRVITSSFAGAPGDAFSITGQEVEQNGVVISAALTLMQVNGIESSIAYSGEFRDGYDAHALIGQIRFAF